MKAGWTKLLLRTGKLKLWTRFMAGRGRDGDFLSLSRRRIVHRGRSNLRLPVWERLAEVEGSVKIMRKEIRMAIVAFGEEPLQVRYVVEQVVDTRDGSLSLRELFIDLRFGGDRG
jgi:predicted GNAT family acetyltransferase